MSGANATTFDQLIAGYYECAARVGPMVTPLHVTRKLGIKAAFEIFIESQKVADINKLYSL